MLLDHTKHDHFKSTFSTNLLYSILDSVERINNPLRLCVDLHDVMKLGQVGIVLSLDSRLEAEECVNSERIYKVSPL